MARQVRSLASLPDQADTYRLAQRRAKSIRKSASALCIALTTQRSMGQKRPWVINSQNASNRDHSTTLKVTSSHLDLMTLKEDELKALHPFWYHVLPLERLGPEPFALELLGQQLVLWLQPDGSVAVAEDRCCHRSDVTFCSLIPTRQLSAEVFKNLV